MILRTTPFLVPCIWLALTSAPARALTLDEAVDLALTRHPDVRGSELRVQVARLAMQDAEAQRWSVTTDVNALQRGTQSASTGGAGGQGSQSTIQSNLSVNVPLFTGFRISHAIAAAREDLAASEADRRQNRLEVSLQVARAFWGLARTEGGLAIQREALTGAEQLHGLTQAGVRSGRLSASELDQAEAAVLAARTEVLGREADRQDARIRLATLVGLDPGALELEGTDGPLPSPLSRPEFQPERRADWQALQARTQAAHERQGVAEASRYPQLALGSTLQLGNNPFDPARGTRGLQNDLAGVLDARLTLSYDAFDWTGRIAREVARANQDATRQEIALEKLRRDTTEQVQVARARLEAAIARASLAARSVVVARKVLDWTTTRQSQGYATQLEVVQARNQLVTSRLQELQASIEARLARTELDHLTTKEAR
jgi:outer membrane protein TolC